MEVICNASPVIGLSIIGRLDILWNVFDKCFVPTAVYEEVVLSKGILRVGAKELQEAVQGGFIKVYAVNNRLLVDQLIGRLHRGELEVVVAAKELGISRVIIDDKSARIFAETMLLKTIGLVGVIRLAKDVGLIERVKPCLDTLVANEYRLSLKIYNEVLKQENKI